MPKINKRKASGSIEHISYPKKHGNAKTAFKMENQQIKLSILADYMEQGGQQGEKSIGAIVLEYFPYMKPDTAKMYGWRILNSPEVKEQLRKKMHKREYNSVLSIEERRQYLSDIIMGVLDLDADLSDKLKCLKLLNDMDGIGTSQFSINVNNEISMQDKRKITEQTVNKLLGVQEAEYVEHTEEDSSE